MLICTIANFEEKLNLGAENRSGIELILRFKEYFLMENDKAELLAIQLQKFQNLFSTVA